MKKLLTKIILILPLLSFSQGVDTTNVCGYKPHLTKIYLIEGTVESTNVKVRELTDVEKCLVEQLRKEKDTIVTIRLDHFTEVKILPKNKTKKL
jgi:hypothetical protein